jgi:hypothetical protein
MAQDAMRERELYETKPGHAEYHREHQARRRELAKGAS